MEWGQSKRAQGWTDTGTEGHPQPPAEPDCPTPTAQTTQGHNGAAQEN